MSSPKDKGVRAIFSTAILCLSFLLAFGLTACQQQGEKETALNETTGKPNASDPSKPAKDTSVALGPGGAVIEVDGAKMTKAQLDAEVNSKLSEIQDKIPAEKLDQVKANIQKGLVEDFVVKTLLNNEVNRLKITATNEEIDSAIEKLKSTLPANMTLEDLMKKNHLTREKMREEIQLGIRINKLISPQIKNLPAPTEKEISDFYKNNQNRFKVPEAVHARHILIAKAPGDSAALLAQKKAKAEGLRKQISAGADFAELARSHSDCPSKSKGGDLGNVTRGQMVKPFEDAVFALKKNQIGPVVETEYGFHVVQALGVRPPKTIAFDEKTKAMISAYLQQQKQQDVFKNMIRSLKEKAKIVSYLS